ncbi:MAG: hypothetical protein NVS3B17_23740 [Vulcanimicrobiaceae bacterium]
MPLDRVDALQATLSHPGTIVRGDPANALLRARTRLCACLAAITAPYDCSRCGRKPDGGPWYAVADGSWSCAGCVPITIARQLTATHLT